ncbi:DNA repair protein endonuclease SAE2/CtIP C-terminus-domain-containing protein [Coniochaeta sp. 2T2.1]|nr:DNA repair protein endonuclease SAE2/CtIP C-terminus-domain-containing protein [Coniochaeta sp. 2T2.1]
MASWLDRGRPAIFEALQLVCDRIDADLADELQQRDVEQHAFLTKEVERLRTRVANVDNLEEENRALKDEVAALRTQLKSAPIASESLRSQASTATPVPRRQPLGEISTNTPSRAVGLKPNAKEANPDHNFAAKFAELEQNYAKLATLCEQQKRMKGLAEGHARKYKEQVVKWEEYAKSLEARIAKLKKRGLASGLHLRSSTEPREPQPVPKTPGVDATPGDTVSVSTPKATLGSSIHPPISASVSFSGFENADLPELSPRRATSSPPNASRTVVAADTESTQGDEDDAPRESDELPPLPPNDNTLSNVIVKSEPSSDLPVFVSERRVGKRKHMDDITEGMTSRTPRRFKAEEGSSDPLVMGESHHFSPQESLDLDHDGSMPTPRKIQLLQMQDRSGVINPDNDNIQARSALFDVRSPRSRANLRDAVQLPHTALKDMHVYAAPVQRPTPITSKPHRKFPDSGLKLNDGVASLAEDGYDPTRTGRLAPTEPHVNDVPSRLNTLLNSSSPAPQGQTPLLRPNRQPREASRLDSWLIDTPVRILPFGKGDGKDGNARTTTPQIRTGGGLDSAPGFAKATWRQNTPKTATPAVKSKATIKRLRDQPLSSFKMDDFRVNPTFNNGHDFAFTEVVRNKDERAELPGCVDEQCCGKFFRTMAKSELEAAGPTLIHRPADIILMEDYLGDQVYKLGSMKRQEKEELWLEAKIRDLANKHGKHKHRFQRRQSPPGFWNADFPSTQENQKDRAEGEKREKRMIEERYREAMRPGGRWLFRDELGSSK